MSSSKWGLRYAITVVILAILTLPALALAQTSMGGVSGTVKDSTGGVVPGATVRLVSEATGVVVERQTNESGFFSFVNVRPGTYNLTIELTGFNKAQVTPFTVGVNEAVSRNVTLQVGAMTETTTVVSQSELIQTSSAELGNVVQERVIRDLPLQGRNFTQLLLLTPGVNPISTAQGPQSETAVNSIEGNSGIPGGMIANASIQGQQNRSKVYYMDGIINTSVRAGTYVALPDIDSLQEFKVQSQSDKAEFGGVTGGVVNMISKSGTNRYRRFRLRLLPQRRFRRPQSLPGCRRQQATRVSVKSTVRRKPRRPDLQEQDVLLRVVRRLALSRFSQPDNHCADRAGSWRETSRKVLPTASSSIPTRREPRTAVTVRDPFPGNVIPQHLISPTMQAFLRAYMVQPNIPGNVRENFRTSREQESNSNSFQARIDHHFSTSDNIFFRWTERRINAFIPRGDRGFQEPDSINRNWGGGWFHSFSPNHGSRGARRARDAADRGCALPARARRRAAAESQSPGTGSASTDTSSGRSGSIRGPACRMLGVQGPRPRGNPNWNAAADLTWLRGKHNFKFGFQMLQISRLQRNQFGQLLFSTEATRNPQVDCNDRRSAGVRAAGAADADSRVRARSRATSTSIPRRCLATSRTNGR